jgi:Caspase domain
MARIRGRSWFSIGAVAVAFFWAVSAAQSGEQIPAGLFGIFGGLINTAIVDAARRDWQTRPLSDYNCLARHGVSADQLANSGIGPESPQVRQILSECAFATPAAPVPVMPQPANGPIAAPPSPNYAAPSNPNFVVNGLALGAQLGPQADAAAGYVCRASDDYPGFAWCQSHHAESRKFGAETTWMSVFRSETNAAVEITQAVDPAFFRQGDAEREIQRLSRDFRQQARVIAADLPSGGHAVIAAWGAVTFTPLDSATMDALRGGAPVHSGLLVGALGDLRASARLGLPVYGLGGGAGFIWSANYNSSGKGVLRVTAVDPSALSSRTLPQPAAPAPSPLTAAQAAPKPPTTPALSLDDVAHRERERTDQLEKVVVAAIQPAASADSANAPASISAFAGQTTEAKVEPPTTAPLASPTSPVSRLSRRVALIVANGAYREAPLTNPTVDADIVAGSLEKIGFSVTVKKDLDLDGFEQAISEFAETTRGAEIALFYFAGHGFSVADGGRQENLLMATSANFSAKTALALEGGGEPLDHVEDTIVGRARTTLIFIDACRNIPALASRGFGSRGFTPLNASNLGGGVYVVLSTRVGQTADDGAGGQGSPFARAFASVLPTPGLRIEDAYSRMREQVRRETSGVQVPESIRSDLPEGGVVLVESNLK